MKVMLVINDTIVHNMDSDHENPEEVIALVHDAIFNTEMNSGHEDDMEDAIDIVIGPEKSCNCGCSCPKCSDDMYESNEVKLKVGDKVKDNKTKEVGNVYIVGLDKKEDNYVINFNGEYSSRSIDEINPIVSENAIEIEIDDNEFTIDNNSDSEVEVKVKDGEVDIDVQDIEEPEEPEEMVDYIEMSVLKLDDGIPMRAIKSDENALLVDSIEISDNDIEFEFRDMMYKFPTHDEGSIHIDLTVSVNDGGQKEVSFEVRLKDSEDYDAIINLG